MLQSINKHVFVPICSKLDKEVRNNSSTNEMSVKIAPFKRYLFELVPNQFKIQKKVVLITPYLLEYVPD